jgi:uncharacterized membrane protein YsdA (DUF1294 family)
MALLTLVATTSFLCVNPTHYDGDEIRCAGRSGSMKLYSIDAPRLRGDCRRGRACVPGDPIAARDRLAGLTRDKTVKCTFLDPGRTGSRDVRCSAGGVDLSCAMVDGGLAYERQYPLNCDKIAPSKRMSRFAAETRDIATLRGPLMWWVPLVLVVANIVSYGAFVADKRRARAGLNRIADVHLLALVLFGGGIGALLAQLRRDHMRTDQPFATQFAILVGLQLGTLVGLLGMLLWPVATA